MDDYFVNRNGNKNSKSDNNASTSLANWSLTFAIISIPAILTLTYGLLAACTAITLAILSGYLSDGKMPGRARAGLVIGIIIVIFSFIMAASIVAVMNNLSYYQEFYKQYMQNIRGLV